MKDQVQYLDLNMLDEDDKPITKTVSKRGWDWITSNDKNWEKKYKLVKPKKTASKTEAKKDKE